MSGHGHHKKHHGASRQDMAIMGATFIMGIIAGAYLYVIAFAPQFEEYVGQTEEMYSDFILEGSQYGDAEISATLPSFQVLKDGSFRYIPESVSGEIPTAKEGKVPNSIMREVKAALNPDNLAIASAASVSTDCASDIGDVDYQYNVSLGEDEYQLDSCKTNFSLESEVGTSLTKLWNYFETLD